MILSLQELQGQVKRQYIILCLIILMAMFVYVLRHPFHYISTAF